MEINVRKNRISLVLPIAISLVALTSCSAANEDSTRSNADSQASVVFAATACSAWQELDELDAINADVPLSLTGSGPEQHAEALSTAEAFLAQLVAAREDTVDAAADLAVDGERIATRFADYFDERIDNVQSAIDRFIERGTDAGPTNDQVAIAAIDLFGDMSYVGAVYYDFPFEGIADRNLLTAIDDEPTCAKILQIR